MKESLNNIYDNKNNSFTILSVVMSIMIIYYHCYPLFFGITSKKSDIFTELMGISLGEVIVGAFFVISGFMIITSLNNSKNIAEYLKKRFIKIFPPLIFCLLICALVIAPILSDIPKWDFIKSTKLYSRYIFDNIFLWKNTQYGIADVFINNPYPAAINGSIWTIKHQFFMYILIIAINFAILKKNKEYYKYFCFIILVITMVSFTGRYDLFFKNLSKNFNDIGIFVEGSQLLKLICYFCMGVFFNIYSDRIIIKNKYASFSLLLLILCRKTIVIRCLCLLIIPYITIYLGTLKSKIKLTDISYQIYIWAFPIQQMIMYYLGGKINLYVYIALSISMTCAVAYVTYYITEWSFKKLKTNYSIPGFNLCHK